MTIAITGSTGQLGRLVVQKVKATAPDRILIALARSREKAEDLGIRVREADYERPDTLLAALKGVETLLLISGSELGKRTGQHRNVIEAAKQNRVSGIVYTSILHADRSPLNIAEEHRATETMLVSSGIPHTILRNGWYNENYINSIATAVMHGALIGSAGEGRISAASRADYAEAAARVLTDDRHTGATYELAGDESFTMSELAAEISRQSGRQIPYQDLPEADYAAALREVGVPDSFATAIASWDVCAAEGALSDGSQQLAKLIGRRTTPISDTVSTVLKP